MHLSDLEQRQLAACFALLTQGLGERDIRMRLGEELLRLFRADHFASYIWNPQTNRFDHGFSINMDEANLQRYEDWFQYRDPITFKLQQRRCATLVSEVMPRQAFIRSEFFNDFLARDGLHWGINLHAYDQTRAMGDLRIWRGKHRNDFSAHDRSILEFIEPALVAALKRAGAATVDNGLPRQPDPSPAAVALSPRELAVARCVARGMTDKEIAQALKIGVPSVRTYLRRALDKRGLRRRSALAGAMQNPTVESRSLPSQHPEQERPVVRPAQ
ncbi:helix-turn-helix transcriptional regulator [Hydrogenophaga crassostreae]|uniref:Helix-turn-helix transcriptional regulator n=1 Tax=Hydrogenophaga crassostreae TaxID=1763535 RepID=A0A1D8NUS2_9BURK|nr:LuxR C-terminal-related transcriptional regulator [Hydrogenophaga crassostreae]AOW12854.1 helix-turn-helix transcriptional regulator [Hydrogenophaga crassostreae]